MKKTHSDVVWWVGVNESDMFFRVSTIELPQYILLEKDGFEFRIFAPNYEMKIKED